MTGVVERKTRRLQRMPAAASGFGGPTLAQLRSAMLPAELGMSKEKAEPAINKDSGPTKTEPGISTGTMPKKGRRRQSKRFMFSFFRNLKRYATDAGAPRPALPLWPSPQGVSHKRATTPPPRAVRRGGAASGQTARSKDQFCPQTEIVL